MDKCLLFMVRQGLNYLAKMTRRIFGGVKVMLSNLRTLYQLLSMVAVASCAGAVFPLVVVVCGTK